MVSLDLPPGTLPIMDHPNAEKEHHITIVYTGDIDDSKWEMLNDQVAEIAEMTPWLVGTIKDHGTFPASESSDWLTPYFARPYVPGIDHLRNLLLPWNGSEHTSYHPHITLAYLRPEDRVPVNPPTASVIFDKISTHRQGAVNRYPLQPFWPTGSDPKNKELQNA